MKFVVLVLKGTNLVTWPRCYGNHLLVANKMEKDDAKTDLDEAVNEFLTYDEYLDSKITPSDLYYLEVILNTSVLFHFLPRFTNFMFQVNVLSPTVSYTSNMAFLSTELAEKAKMLKINKQVN